METSDNSNDARQYHFQINIIFLSLMFYALLLMFIRIIFDAHSQSKTNKLSNHNIEFGTASKYPYYSSKRMQ